MTIDKLRQIVETRLQDILESELCDYSEWEDLAIENDLTEEDMEVLLEEVIPNATISVTVD